MAATVQQIPSARTATRLSAGISLSTSSGDELVDSGGHNERKSAKTKRNELKLVFGEYRDGRKEEKMVKELLKEGSEIARNVTLPAVGSTSTETQQNYDTAAIRSDAHQQLVNRKHRLYGAEAERRTACVLKSHLQREAVVNAWQDEQSKVNRPTLSRHFIHPAVCLTTGP
jgi:hypothetical protein